MGITFDAAFSSKLRRASASCSLMLETMKQSGVRVEGDVALNERDYGDLTGLNKDEARRQFGNEQVHLWRRSYAVAPPHGESLRDTIARVLPYYISRVLPTVMRSQAVLVVAHGNSLRALILALEKLSAERIPLVEMGTAEMRFYRLAEDTSATSEGTWAVPPTSAR
jgi:2,3-bisphosphoglycerate-dependent phosphoglycerate mutase